MISTYVNNAHSPSLKGAYSHFSGTQKQGQGNSQICQGLLDTMYKSIWHAWLVRALEGEWLED